MENVFPPSVFARPAFPSLLTPTLTPPPHFSRFLLFFPLLVVFFLAEKLWHFLDACVLSCLTVGKKRTRGFNTHHSYQITVCLQQLQFKEGRSWTIISVQEGCKKKKKRRGRVEVQYTRRKNKLGRLSRDRSMLFCFKCPVSEQR